MPKDQDIEALIAQDQTIKVPVLVIWGQEDEVVPLKGRPEFQAGYPGLATCRHSALRPYTSGRGAAGDAAGDWGFLKRI